MAYMGVWMIMGANEFVDSGQFDAILSLSFSFAYDQQTNFYFIFRFIISLCVPMQAYHLVVNV